MNDTSSSRLRVPRALAKRSNILPWLLLAAALGGCATAPSAGRSGPSAPAGGRAPAAVRAPADPSSEAPAATAARTTPRPMPARRSAQSEAPQTGSADVGRSGSALESAPALPNASRALLDQSRGERASGSYAAAASSVERALRIDPNNAALWVELGEIKLEEDDPVQAQMMARKALTLAGGDRNVVARANRLIDRAACASGRC